MREQLVVPVGLRRARVDWGYASKKSLSKNMKLISKERGSLSGLPLRNILIIIPDFTRDSQNNS
jgi:hypothetical protein